MVAGKSEWRIVFLGPPGSGKGTQAELLAKEIDISAISTGQMLRDAVADQTEVGVRVEDVMSKGELVDDSLMAEVVRDRLAQSDTDNGFILDGYPRTLVQAKDLDNLLKSFGVQLDLVLLINASEKVLVERGLGRGREDDDENIIRNRLRIYQLKTKPLIEFYDTRNILYRIDGDKSIEDVRGDILAALRE